MKIGFFNFWVPLFDFSVSIFAEWHGWFGSLFSGEDAVFLPLSYHALEHHVSKN